MAVTIYSTPTCPYCKLAKEFMKKNKIKFKNVDVSTNQKAQKTMMDKSNQSAVPVIDANGEIIVGFSESKLKKALKLK